MGCEKEKAGRRNQRYEADAGEGRVSISGHLLIVTMLDDLQELEQVMELPTE
jgi:hypothetical protein